MEILIPMKSKNTFRFIIIIIYILRFIGLAPFTIKTKTSNKHVKKIVNFTFLFSKKGFIYNIILLFHFFLLHGIEFPYFRCFDYANKSVLTEGIDLLQFGLSCFTTYIIILTWSFRQKMAVRIINKLLEIDRLLDGIKPQNLNKKFKIYVIVHIIFIFTISINFVITLALENTDSFIIQFILNIQTLIHFYFIVQYFMIVRLLVFKFQAINDILLKFKELPNHLLQNPLINDHITIFNLSTHSRLTALHLIQNIRTTLFETSQDIADFFSLPILLCIGYCFITIVYNVYYFIDGLFFSSNTFFSLSTLTITILWIIIGAYPLIVLCFNITEVVCQAKQTGRIVHKLLATSMKQEIKAALQLYSLQLLHEHLSFTAYGFFTIDSTLLQSILTATATYLVIFIQFMQSPENN